MVQRGGTVKMNVQNVTLLVCVATLVMVACVLFKTCVNEGFQGNGRGVNTSGNGNPNNASAGNGESSSLVTNNQSPNGGGGGVCSM